MIRILFVFIVFLPFLIVAEVKPDKENIVKPVPENNTEIKSEKNNEVKPTVEVKNEIPESKIEVPKDEKQIPVLSIKSEYDSSEKENFEKVTDCKKAIATYQEILEKTNSQLSMWFNPYGFFVAALGILFTICTIIFGYWLYKQSKESKEKMDNVIKDSQEKINDSQKKMDNVVIDTEKKIDNSIEEYKKNLESIEKERTELKFELNRFMKKVMAGKDFFEIKKNVYHHSGRNPININEEYEIAKSTNFSSKILLDAADQRFTIFMKILGSDQKKYWLGFGGRVMNENEKTWKSETETEFDILRNYNSEVVDINENIWTQFKRGFPEINPVKIVGIRFRGSDENKNEITFSYKISQSETDSL